MPDLVEHMYCSQQINIPATFPYILKQYAKCAIRTQPHDLLRWTAMYFRAIANDEVPPVKLRFEHVPLDSPPGLTPGYLRVLLKQMGHARTVTIEQLFEKWNGVCLEEDSLLQLLKIGEFVDEIDWLHFVAIAAGHMTRSLGETMILLCQLLTREPEGGSSMIPCTTFNELYTYLAKLDCGPPESSSELAIAESGVELTKTPSTASIKTPSTVHLSQVESIESVGEEPPLPPLVYFRPSEHPMEVGDGGVPEGGIEEGRELPPGSTDVLGEDPYTYRQDVDVVGHADEETQTERLILNQTEKERVYVPGIGPELCDEHVEAVVKYMEWWAERQEGMSMPRNIRHFLCPPLDKLPVQDPCTDQYHYPNTNLYP